MIYSIIEISSGSPDSLKIVWGHSRVGRPPSNRADYLCVSTLLVDGSWLIAGAASAGIVVGFARAILRRSVPTSVTTFHWDEVAALTSAFLDGNADGTLRLATLVRQSPASTIDAMAALCRRAEGELPLWPTAVSNAAADWLRAELSGAEASQRRRALEFVGSLGLVALRAEVIECASDEDEGVRIAACRSLVAIDPDTAVGVLLGLVEQQGVWAANLLVHVVDRLPAHSGAIVRRVEEWTASSALVTLLGEMTSPAALTVLHAAIENPDQDIALAGLNAVLDRAEPLPARLTQPLIGLLSADIAAVRRAAARGLGRVGRASSAVALAGALGDSDRSVRFAAAEALMQLPNGIAVLDAVVDGQDAAAVEAARVALWASNTEDDMFTMDGIEIARGSLVSAR